MARNYWLLDHSKYLIKKWVYKFKNLMKKDNTDIE